jgi:hypothetical protein
VLAFADASFVAAMIVLFCTPLVLLVHGPRSQQ